MTSASLVIVATIAASLVSSPSVPAAAQTKVSVCGLLPKAEVKKLLGANDAFDRAEPKEEPTKTGSSCRYPDLLVMVNDGNLDGVRKNAQFEAVSGIGQEAFLSKNAPGGIELFVRVGSRQLGLSRRVEAAGTDAARAGVIALGKALAAKLQ